MRKKFFSSSKRSVRRSRHIRSMGKFFAKQVRRSTVPQKAQLF